MILGLITFLWGQKFLYGHADPSNPEVLKEKVFGFINREYFIYICSALALGLVWLLVQREPIVHLTQNILLITSIVGIILYALFYNNPHDTKKLAAILGVVAVVLGVAASLFESGLLGSNGNMTEYLTYAAIGAVVAFVAFGYFTHPSKEYSQTVVLMILIVSTVVFWALFEQSAGSMTFYADRVVDRNVMGVEVKASQFGSLNAGFIMLLAIPFAALWVWLAKRNLEPSTPVKFALGIFQVGLGFGALVLAANNPNEAGKVAYGWLVLAYLLHTTGELCLSPVGLSAVTKLSIPKVVGVSMGTWFLATALSETLATRIGKWAAIDTSGAETADIATSLATYTDLFGTLMWFGIGTGVFMFVISPLLRKGMHDIH
jgi:POT family proton-dependent oligopeptide transporter